MAAVLASVAPPSCLLASRRTQLATLDDGMPNTLTGVADSQAQIDEASKMARAADGAHTQKRCALVWRNGV